ncbi:helix-turn-helix domain-containing protein [Pseudonocardia broussonetiae]|uniref:Helix-turn-helix domain-containing protein n=1 Tax=Pseudonocardia broussonetiae TaxID=2736640 RepID=A0A6M6JM32_9PSEU|nr:helix-turn-helix transcriptional regulator [Pseudonocardia broussonetiae]QJY47997.1 helix-turn-helix domain-containing protein [Pseudonocardia broussonetiae]
MNRGAERGAVRGTALGEFLAARRALVSPATVGLPDDGARRVPGLRREEVALLAGVSTDYYIRLEQGRERHPSRQVLGALAGALRLDEDAARHLYRIGLPAVPALATETTTTVAAPLQQLLDQMHTVPAFVVGPGQDVLAANALAEVLYRGFARFDNLLRMIFLDPHAREFYADWDSCASVAVRDLRATTAVPDQRTEQVIGALTVRSPAFAALWARYEVGPRIQEDKHFHHPDVGEIRLHFEKLTIDSAPGQHLSVYTAEPGTAAADGLALLTSLAADRATVDRREGQKKGATGRDD